MMDAHSIRKLNQSEQEQLHLFLNILELEAHLSTLSTNFPINRFNSVHMIIQFGRYLYFAIIQMFNEVKLDSLEAHENNEETESTEYYENYRGRLILQRMDIDAEKIGMIDIGSFLESDFTDLLARLRQELINNYTTLSGKRYALDLAKESR